MEMTRTGFFSENTGDKNAVSSLYGFSEGGLKSLSHSTNSSYFEKPTIFSGGGGMQKGYGALFSTASDFANFSKMLLQYGTFNGKKILKPQTVELLISDQISGIKRRSFPIAGYGFGVGVNNRPNNGKTSVVSWTGAYNTIFLIDFQKNLIAIFLTQHYPWGYLNVMDQFVDLLVEQDKN